MNPSVLVVDDEPDIVLVYRRVLERAGFDVVSAGSALEALRLIDLRRPDAIITDMTMPGGSGGSFISSIRRRPELASIAVIVVTGRSRKDPVWEGRNWGWDHYLEKPVDAKQLVSVVRQLVGVRA